MAEVVRPMSPWQPMRDPRAKAVFGKLGEELGELIAAKSRCEIQGLMECEPQTGKVNRAWLREELADVMGMVDLVIWYFDLERDEMAERAARKMIEKQNWLKTVDMNGQNKWT